MTRALLAAALAAAACSDPSPPPSPATRIARALGAAVDTAHENRAPWRCAAPDGPALVEETLKAGAHEWTLAAATMQRAARGDGSLAIGVIADAGGAAPRTLAALGALRRKFPELDLLVTLGGMGATQTELEATLGVLADGAAWPLLALPGDLEPAGALSAAIAKLRARGAVVVDGRLARRVELPGVVIATVPGAGAAVRLMAGPDGCSYRTSDAITAFAELTARPEVRILASAEAPRIAAGGEPAGELALTAGATHEVDIALHGPTTEAPTPERAGVRDGNAVALTPGSSDATTRLPGPRRAPSAGVLTIRGRAWRWKPITDAGT